jgi:hypothetical protein
MIKINKSWERESENQYFRSDEAYAGKDYTKDLKTFCGIAPFIPEYPDEEISHLTGFKTIPAAMRAVDKKWPLKKNDGS